MDEIQSFIEILIFYCLLKWIRIGRHFPVTTDGSQIHLQSLQLSSNCNKISFQTSKGSAWKNKDWGKNQRKNISRGQKLPHPQNDCPGYFFGESSFSYFQKMSPLASKLLVLEQNEISDPELKNQHILRICYLKIRCFRLQRNVKIKPRCVEH